ncbi:HEAT repeat domain-containing protein, partial [Archangium violaceum]|uniref:HEAT repeat domain-containing protein n=1 Tax=Archangium violaceum TaxID=83451 RepID=UPI001269DDC7
VRQTAALALGFMGEAAREQAPLLVDRLLKDPSADVRQSVALALGNMGEAAREQVPRLVSLSKSPDEDTRGWATLALMRMGTTARDALPALGERLKDPDGDVRAIATEALANLARKGVVAPEQAPLLGALLDDPDWSIRDDAAFTLGFMGEAARDYVPRLVELLRDPKILGVSGWESLSATSVGRLGEVARPWLPRLVELLEDPLPTTRARAAQTLGMMREVAREQAPRVARLLEDPDLEVRRAAVRALARMGAREYAPQIAGLLDDPARSVQKDAAEALGRLGAREQLPVLIAHAEIMDHDILQDPAWAAIISMIPLEPPYIAFLAAEKGGERSERARWLARAHGLGGGAPESERALRWLGGRASAQLPSAEGLTLEEARATLRDFATLWPQAEQFPVLADELSQQIAQVAMLGRGRWQASDRALLEQHEKNLRGSQPQHAASVRAALDSISRKSLVPARKVAGVLAAHAGFWLLLIFFYPRSTKVQAVFFWNPWVRRLLGLGYVGVLLTWVPFLRRRLLAPFQRLLVADADLGRFSPEAYFERSEVRVMATGQRVPLLRALPRLEGLVLLEGASGLGKSMFIRYLLSRSKRLAVYLPAVRCKEGVLEAIQAKLEGQARDTSFLQSIIYSGALDIYIDGLNEVSADTRSRIVGFVEPRFHGNILLATQRMEWTPPATADRYELQPLTEEQVRDFLFSREPLLGDGARLRGEAYREVCEHFLSLALTPEQPEELRREMLEVLSNPMDLTLVAQMLAAGHAPDLFHLQEQQYELMARDYQEKNLTEFPLKTFSEEAYQMRLQDRSAIPEKDFDKELQKMEAYKLVVRRQWRRPDGQEGREWHFRHDKLWDFFIAQTFLGKDNERILEHQDDPRFRGVYFLLAKLLEPEVALEVQDHLVEHAAETRDHTVSDEFVTRLQDRWRAEQARPPAP